MSGGVVVADDDDDDDGDGDDGDGEMKDAPGQFPVAKCCAHCGRLK